jgi:hypothetical protein
MAILNIDVPIYDGSFYKESDISQIKRKLDSIYGQYKFEIDQASKLTNVHKNLFISIIFTESSGQANALSNVGAAGLMQLKPDTACGILQYEHIKGRLTESEKSILRKYLGTRLDCIMKQKWMNQPLPCNNDTGNSITKEDLFKPEFNTLCGGIFLGILIDQETKNGKLNLPRVLVRYAKGYFYKIKGTTEEEVLAELTKGSEAHSYLLKVTGKNGLLSILNA